MTTEASPTRFGISFNQNCSGARTEANEICSQLGVGPITVTVFSRPRIITACPLNVPSQRRARQSHRQNRPGLEARLVGRLLPATTT